MAWRIELDSLADKDLAKLDPQIARRILKFLYERIAALDNPRDIGAALQGAELGNYWKYRVGDYRVVAKINDNEITILVLRIGNRKQVYR